MDVVFALFLLALWVAIARRAIRWSLRHRGGGRTRQQPEERRSFAPRQHDSISYPDGATRHALSCWCRRPR